MKSIFTLLLVVFCAQASDLATEKSALFATPVAVTAPPVAAQTLVNGRAAVLPAERFSAPDAWRSGTAAVLYPLAASPVSATPVAPSPRAPLSPASAPTTPAAAGARSLLILAPNYRAAGTHFAASIDGRAQEFAVRKGDYAAEAITVAPGFVAKKPAPALRARIKKEAAQAAAVYASSSKKSYIRRRFAAPLASHITSPFGRARTFNGALRSYHSGTDFRAAPGTPIPAANDGVVALSADRYYAGGSVVIDHGHGVFTQYYHLSRRDVAVGERVARGQIIGLSGATGRVSGPHFHLGVAIRGVSVDPLAFFAAINAFLPED